MSSPEKRLVSPNVPDPEPDFYQKALAQIHHDAQPDANAPAAALPQAAQTVCASVCSWADTLRRRISQRDPAAVFAPPSDAPAVDAAASNVPSPAQSSESAAGRRFHTEKPPVPTPAADKASAAEELSRRAEKSRRNRAAAASHAEPASSAAKPAAPARKKSRHFAAASRTKQQLRPAVRWILCMTLVLLIAVLGWLGFGYRSCMVVANRYGNAMYRADAETMYSQFDKTMLDALVTQKRFNNVDEFLESESQRLKKQWNRYFNSSVGTDWKASISTVNVSDLYENECKNSLKLYQQLYDRPIHEVRYIHVSAEISGSLGEKNRTDTLIMVRIGLWWYVADEIFL